MKTPKRMVLIRLAAVLACIGSLPASAVDGVVLIDQNKALAGNVTPGDAPGFPVTLSVSGSYRLAGDLTLASPTDTGVLIAANNVTLDLNGFSILGSVTCTDSGTQITCPGSINPNGSNGIGVVAQTTIGGVITGGITVENGHIQVMGAYGVFIAFGGVVRNVTARHNGALGIRSNTIRDSLAEYNGGTGFEGDLIENSYAANNLTGFRLSGLLTRSIARSNRGYGLICVDGDYSGNTFWNNTSPNTAASGQFSNCLGKNAGGNFCNGTECPAF
jgi:hypothetical protein